MAKPEKKILLIINPTSGKMKSKHAAFDMIEHFTKAGGLTTVLTTTKRGDATEYVEKYAPMHDVVVCCGGDGTLNETITGMMRLKDNIPIGFVPCGSTNDMAKTLQLPYRSISDCVDMIVTGDAKPFDIGLFNQKRFFNYVASFGAFTRISYDTPQWMKNMLGHAAYFIDSVKAVTEIRPYHMTIKTDNGVIEDDFLFGSVTNSLSVAGIVKLKENDVSLCDGMFEIMLVRKPDNPADLSRILDGFINKKFDDKYVRFLHSRTFYAISREKIAWTLDGEYGGKHSKVTVRNLHNAVSMFRK